MNAYDLLESKQDDDIEKIKAILFLFRISFTKFF
jgi:hypothetical protein